MVSSASPATTRRCIFTGCDVSSDLPRGYQKLFDVPQSDKELVNDLTIAPSVYKHSAIWPAECSNGFGGFKDSSKYWNCFAPEVASVLSSNDINCNILLN